MSKNVIFEIIARDRASEAFDRISRHADSTGGRLKKFGLMAAAGLAATGVGVAAAGVEFTKMAMEDEESANRLAKALQNNAHATKQQIASTEEWITKQGLAYGVADDDLRPALGRLVTATHDVTKAQKLAKLAMDVSAGSGKDLSTVAMALTKAQNGNVGALGRLGFKVKDSVKDNAALQAAQIGVNQAHAKYAAALAKYGANSDQARLASSKLEYAQTKLGQAQQKTKSTTITAEEAMQRLAKTYGGQAADRANTVAGKMARLQLILRETGESIGYKLLPVATKLADWMLKDAVPATSKFFDEMKNGTGTGGQVADVLQDIANAGKGVLSFFGAMPGPVKKYGAELLIATVVMGQVRSGATKMAATFAASSTEMAASATRTQLAMARLRGGATMLAGAGGIVALTKSAHESSLAVAGLERVGGAAAVGFSVGGPLGAAIGGTTGLLWTMKDAFSTNAKTTKVSLPTYKQYADTLDGVAASATKATREMVLQRLEQSGLLDATRKLGLSDREAVAAMMGQHTARAKLVDLMRSSTAITMKQKDALEQETGAVGAARLAQLKHNIAVAGSKDELQKARKALRDFMHEPASKRVSVTGVETARAQLKSLRQALRSVWNQGPDLHTAGPGGLNVLLNPGGAAKPSARTGGTSNVQNFNFGNVYAANLDDLLHQAQRKSRTNALSGSRP